MDQAPPGEAAAPGRGKGRCEVTAFGEEIQRRFIAHVLKDDTGEKLEQTRALPADVFDNYDCARAWREIRSAKENEAAAIKATSLPFFAVDTAELQWLSDLQAAKIAWFVFSNDWELVGRELSPKRDDWPELESARDHYSDLPPPPSCIVDGLLIEGGVSICSAPSKGRKSWSALHLGFAVATGAEFLGRQCKQGPVIYLNYELKRDTLHRRMHDIRRAMGIEMPEHFHPVNLRGRNVTAQTLREKLPKICEAVRPLLIILDPFYKVSANSGADENSNDGQARLLGELESIAEDCEAALFIVHHFAKGIASGKNAIDRASGAGALARAPDAVLTLSEHEQEDCAVLTSALRDLPPIGDVPLRWEFPLWRTDSTLDAARLKTRAGAPDRNPPSKALEKLSDGMTNQEWLKASGMTESTFRRKRSELADAGKVRETAGCYYHVK